MDISPEAWDYNVSTNPEVLEEREKENLKHSKGTPESSRRTLYLDIQIQENQMGTKKPLDMYIAGCLCGSTRCVFVPLKVLFYLHLFMKSYELRSFDKLT